MIDWPRVIDPEATFNALVEWLRHFDAPGFLVGISGTDSIVAFLAAAKAMPQEGRVKAIHFAPSVEYRDNYPDDAEKHMWFAREVMPWLHAQAPAADMEINTKVDWRCDGQRWGALLDLSVSEIVFDRLSMRRPEHQYWVVGTRNRTEDLLYSYSNASTAASLQPIIHLWKSEVLEIARYLGAPTVALDKSCEVDCVCGRMSFPAKHIQEIDQLLMIQEGELDADYAHTMDHDTSWKLANFISEEKAARQFKKSIPYCAQYYSVRTYMGDLTVNGFRYGFLDLKKFDHRAHAYVAWCYLKSMPFEAALTSYSKDLKLLLADNDQSARFDQKVTDGWFEIIGTAMTANPELGFNDLMAKIGGQRVPHRKNIT